MHRREEKSWRIKLTNVETDELMALELHGDIVVGLGSENEHDLDVNVADWHGEERGVSRRHCRLRPSSSNLFVMDLQSTNGTHVNGIELGEGQARGLARRRPGHTGEAASAGECRSVSLKNYGELTTEIVIEHSS